MKLIFATHNPNKVSEIQAMLPSGIELVSLKDLDDHDEIEETASTIEGNAKLKVEAIANRYNYPCFADDTGLEVNALNAEPGVKSARYAVETKDSKANMRKLLNNLADKSNRKAQFKTVIAYKAKGGQILTFEGICKGEILKSARGEGGFGYDPIFLPSGYTQSFAEMTANEKHLISHRGLAFKKFIKFLSESHKNKTL